MSQESVDIVRRSTDHYNETGEPLWELIDPDIEWVIGPPAPAWVAGTYRGHGELKDLARRTAEAFDEFRYEIEELLPGGDQVVASGAIRVRRGGVTAIQQGASVTRLRDGRIVAVRIYFNREQALRDAGLRE
jgi:ketosteroid isomerase-like protein